MIRRISAERRRWEFLSEMENVKIKEEGVGVWEYRVRNALRYKKESSNCWKGIRNCLKLTTHEVRQRI
jgi:hypothetical protein